MDIQYKLREKRQEKPFVLPENTKFGRIKTDHMFLLEGKRDASGHTEWYNPRIVPNEKIPLSLQMVSLHYGMQCFEGAKAFKHEDDELYAARIDLNAERHIHSANMIEMPAPPVDIQIEGIEALLDVDRLWYPEGDISALYIRPIVIGTTEALGITSGEEFLYAVMLSPVGPYFPEGLNPIKLLITDEYKRAAPGGTGTAKVGGNYAGSLRASRRAEGVGAKQVLYLNVDNTELEEAGAMNHFHVHQKEGIVIPAFTDTILKSNTTKSILELESRLSVQVTQRRIRLDEFVSGLRSGEISEAGGLGTAATVAPVGSYFLNGEEIQVGTGKVGEVTREMFDLLTGIHRGRYSAPEGWMHHIERRN